jgi:uncharacterized protein YceK
MTVQLRSLIAMVMLVTLAGCGSVSKQECDANAASQHPSFFTSFKCTAPQPWLYGTPYP